MMKNVSGSCLRSRGRSCLLFVLFTFMSLFASARQGGITLDLRNTAITKVFSAIEKQSGYGFIYNEGALRAITVDIQVKNAPLATVMETVLNNQPFSYYISGKNIVITPRRNNSNTPQADSLIDISGLVMSADGGALAGASIKVKNSTLATNTNSKGSFTLSGVPHNAVLVVTFLGFAEQQHKVAAKMVIMLQPVTAELKGVTINKGYYTEQRQLSTGAVSSISSKEIEKQPVGNVMQALEGRIPGMVVSQTSGVPGARLNIQVRGRTNFDRDITSDQALVIIDGVPMAGANTSMNNISGPFGVTTGEGLSALAGINVADIESIDVLKDADATAIYGSRGANGVVLITTKRGKAGQMKIDANVYSGISHVTRMATMLNTEQYLAMRNEAFANDNVTKTNANAADLLLFDQTRYTDFGKMFAGSSASTTDAQVNVSGGNMATQYRMGAGYHKEGTVWPGDFSSDRLSLNFNTYTTSANKKFSAGLSGVYSMSKSNLLAADLASAILLPPNFQIYDAAGNLAWNEGGYNTGRDNPMSQLKQKYLANMNNFNVNLLLNYNVLNGLVLRSSIGYNYTATDDKRMTPMAAQNPAKAGLAGFATFGSGNFKSWIIEPQAEYTRQIWKGKLTALAGATFNKTEKIRLTTTGNGYSNDDLIGSLTGAATFTATNAFEQYNYQAFFGRLNYNVANKYIVNFTGRRDGSSRFGPEYRFSNFGAIGAAWLFSNEKWATNIPFLSYGKLRGSYGITGNDQIGEYMYLDTWGAGTSYGDSTTLLPTKLFNPDLHWEKSKKKEIALELGFFKDRLMLTTSFYHNISSEPLVSYPVTRTTGFSTILSNLTGVEVVNRGWEITLTSRNIDGKLKWTTDFNITIPTNYLKKYPNLATSSYATKYSIGRSLNQVMAMQFLGVDPTTGLYTAKDQNNDGAGGTLDFVPGRNTDPRYYGGVNNTFSYKGFDFSFFFQFTKQLGTSWKGNNLYNPPGMAYNVPVMALDRWQKPGDVTDVQKFTTSAGQISGLQGFYAFRFTDGVLTDASFLRLKNVNLSYSLPASWLNAVHVRSCRLYMSAQNLFVITPYKGGDPEIQNYTRMAPLRTITGGLQISL